MTEVSSPVEVITATVPAGSRVLDIGCGSGSFAPALLARGYLVTGVEPQETRIAEARARVPEATFFVATAEALPFEGGAFDAAVMLHSLHHVPVEVMLRALSEAIRCVRPGGPLIVIEPLAEGRFNDVLKLIDDETEIRREAQVALENACRSGILQRVATYRWNRDETYRDAGEFIEDVASVDPRRMATVASRRSEIEKAFAHQGTLTREGYILSQPIRADVFCARS